MAGIYAKATAIGGLPRANRCDCLAASCSPLFSRPGIEKSQSVAPHPFSPRAHARASLRGRSPFERIPRSRRCTGPDQPMRGSAERRKRAFEGPD